MKYQSEIVNEILEQRGHEKSSLLQYESECIQTWIDENKGSYPKLCDYQSEWLNYINEKPIGIFPYETLTDVTEATVNNVVPYSYKSAILSGNTGYRDIDTGEFLETFKEGRNLELVSVKMPVLTTSNEDGTKTNILTVNEEVELRGIGDVRDELDCLTGEVTERIGKIVLDGSQEISRGYTGTYIQLNTLKKSTNYMNIITCDKLPVLPSFEDLQNVANGISGYVTDSYPNENWIYIKINNINDVDLIRQSLIENPITVQYQLATEPIKTVDLTCINQNGENVKFKPIEGTMHIATDGTPIKPTFTGEIPVEAITQNLASFIEE